MSQSDNGEFMEGFLCPMCKKDLGNTARLLAHFQEEHSEEQDLVRTFKDLLDKAKKKILKQEDSIVTPVEYYYEPQEPGLTVSHTVEFLYLRDERIQRLAGPTNQILIRLEKLLDKLPSDPLKRKQYEQDIVPWLDETNVQRCPECALVFFLTRRKHHCRTCGCIMCNDCSKFLSVNTARRILDKPQTDTQSENHFRLCNHCLNLLEVREGRRESKNVKIIISQFYERLSDYRSQADVLILDYTKMANSLNNGESLYSLKDAQTVKVKLIKLAENIEALSSKIAVLGKGSETPPEGQALKLQMMIRAAASAYLRNYFLKIPNLPTEQEFIKIQEKRRMEIANRVQEEKMKQNIKPNRSPRNSSTSNKKPVDPSISMGQSWVPESKKANETEDPLLVQMNIIRSYIKDAKAALKYDEVASLEENLHELKKEYLKKVNEEKQQSGDSSEGASLSSYDGRNYSDSLHGDSSSH